MKHLSILIAVCLCAGMLFGCAEQDAAPAEVEIVMPADTPVVSADVPAVQPLGVVPETAAPTPEPTPAPVSAPTPEPTPAPTQKPAPEPTKKPKAAESKPAGTPAASTPAPEPGTAPTPTAAAAASIDPARPQVTPQPTWNIDFSMFDKDETST